MKKTNISASLYVFFFHYLPYILGGIILFLLPFRELPGIPTPFGDIRIPPLGIEVITGFITNFGWWFLFASIVVYLIYNFRNDAQGRAFFLQKVWFVPMFPATFYGAGLLTIGLAWLAKPVFDFVEGIVYIGRAISGLQAINVLGQIFMINPVIDSPALTYLLAGVLPIIMIIWGIGFQINGAAKNVTGKTVPHNTIWLGYIIPATSAMLLVFMWQAGALSATPKQIFEVIAVFLSPGFAAFTSLVFFIGKDFFKIQDSRKWGYGTAFKGMGLVLLKTLGIFAAVWSVSWGANAIGFTAWLQAVLEPVIMGSLYLLAAALIIATVAFPLGTFGGKKEVEAKKFWTSLAIIIFATIGVVNLELPSAVTSAQAMLWPWKIASPAQVAKTRQDAKNFSEVLRVLSDPSEIVKQDFTVSGLLGGQQTESLLSGSRRGNVSCIITDPTQKRLKPNGTEGRCVQNPSAFVKAVGFPPPKTQMAPKLGYIVMLNFCVLFDIILQGDLLYNVMVQWFEATLQESIALDKKGALKTRNIISHHGPVLKFIGMRAILYMALWFNLLTSSLFEDGRVQNLSLDAINSAFQSTGFCLIFLKWSLFLVAQYLLVLWIATTIADIDSPAGGGMPGMPMGGGMPGMPMGGGMPPSLE